MLLHGQYDLSLIPNVLGRGIYIGIYVSFFFQVVCFKKVMYSLYTLYIQLKYAVVYQTQQRRITNHSAKHFICTSPASMFLCMTACTLHSYYGVIL